MNHEKRKQQALDYLELFASRDADAILARMTDEPEWRFFAQRFEGVDGVRAIIQAAGELYQPGSTERDITGVYVAGDVVVIQSTLRAVTFKGEDYENHYVMFVHFDGDRVARVDEYLDTAYANEKFAGWEMS